MPHIVSRQGAFSVISTGTWVILMAVGGDGPLDPAWDMLASVDVTGRRPRPRGSWAGASSRRWRADAPAQVGAEDIAQAVASGAFALPAFSDQGGPFWRRAGGIEGPAPQTPAARTALATLYVALMTKLMLDKLEAPGDWIVEGGFAKTPAFASLLAALAPGRRVVLAAAIGAAEGAARLARWGQPQPPPLTREAPRWEIPGLADYAARWRERGARAPSGSGSPGA